MTRCDIKTEVQKGITVNKKTLIGLLALAAAGILLLSFSSAKKEDANNKTLRANDQRDLQGVILDPPEVLGSGALMGVRIQPTSEFMGVLPRMVFLDPTSCKDNQVILPIPREPFVAKARVFRAEQDTWIARPGAPGGTIMYFIEPKCIPQ